MQHFSYSVQKHLNNLNDYIFPSPCIWICFSSLTVTGNCSAELNCRAPAYVITGWKTISFYIHIKWKYFKIYLYLNVTIVIVISINISSFLFYHIINIVKSILFVVCIHTNTYAQTLINLISLCHSTYNFIFKSSSSLEVSYSSSNEQTVTVFRWKIWGKMFFSNLWFLSYSSKPKSLQEEKCCSWV